MRAQLHEAYGYSKNESIRIRADETVYENRRVREKTAGGK